MSLFFADLVREACRGTGSGDLPLSGALPGHRRFADAVPPGARFHYAICGVTRPDQWETGEGELGSGDTLVRLPLASSAGPATGAGEAEPVDFEPGLKTIALTVAADWFAGRAQDLVDLEAALEGKQPLDPTLSALAGLDGEADRLAYFTGPDEAGLTAFSAFGRALVDDADAAAARSTLELGSAAVRNVGTSGAAVPLLNGGACSWAGGATFGGTIEVAAAAQAGRETLLKCSVADAGNDGFYVGNATTVDGRFLPMFTGFVDSVGNVQSVMFYGCVAAARDTSGDNGVGVVDFRAGITSNSANPPAGSVSALANRTLFSFRNASGLVANITPTALNLANGTVLRVNGIQIVAARRTGWGTPTGTASRGAFDTATATTAQLAERVKALIDDLAAHGLIGS